MAVTQQSPDKKERGQRIVVIMLIIIKTVIVNDDYMWISLIFTLVGILVAVAVATLRLT